MNLKAWTNTEWRKDDWAVIEAAPKAVLYEIARRMAVSIHGSSCDALEEMAAAVAKEWGLLHENGIVPQKPPTKIKALARTLASDLDAA